MKKSISKKNLIYLFCLCLGLSTITCNAENRGNPLAGEEFTAESYVLDALDAANKGIEVVFPYVADNVYQIYLQQGFVTDIKLSPNETLKYVGAGDTSRWLIDTSSIGTPSNKITHIYVKPTQQGISTNLIINTDKRVYQLLLISGYNFNPIVSWSFPKTSAQLHEDKLNKTYASIDPNKMDFRYKISTRKYNWSPELIFNTEHKTYLKMKAAITNSELPAFFILDDDKKMTLVSYRFVKGYMVIDRLFEKAVLLLGKQKVYIVRKD